MPYITDGWWGGTLFIIVSVVFLLFIIGEVKARPQGWKGSVAVLFGFYIAVNLLAWIMI